MYFLMDDCSPVWESWSTAPVDWDLRIGFSGWSLMRCFMKSFSTVFFLKTRLLSLPSFRWYMDPLASYLKVSHQTEQTNSFPSILWQTSLAAHAGYHDFSMAWCWTAGSWSTRCELGETSNLHTFLLTAIINYKLQLWWAIYLPSNKNLAMASWPSVQFSRFT